MKTIMSVAKKAVSEWHLACMGECILLLFLVSCSRLSNAEENYNIMQHGVHNIYGAVDMSLFHGFENKVTVAELRAKHGEPSIVLDGKNYADADGYDIWKYVVQQDTIDCYVKKEGGIVDFIYNVFAKPHEINGIVKDKQLADEIMSANTFADYLVDDFKGTIQIMKKGGSSKYAISIAIDDNELLTDSQPLREELESSNDNFPIPLADLCDITAWSYDDKVMSINFDVKETPCRTIEKIKSDPDFGNQCVTYLFGDRGRFSFLKPKIVDEKADINLVFRGMKTKSTAVFKVEAWRILAPPTTALQRIKAMIAYDNMGAANQCDDTGVPPTMIMNPREIKNNVLYISITYASDVGDMTDTSFKDHVVAMYLSKENPDQEIVLLCAQSGLGLSFSNTCFKNGKQKTYTANFTNSELKALREKIK